MHTWRIRAAIGAATTALVAGVGGAGASTPASGATEVHVRKFVATEIFQHPLGERGFVSSEVERHNGRLIGTDSVTGRFNLKTGVAKIHVAVAWKGGALIIRGRSTQDTPFVGKIARGTGRYAGAEGTVTTRELGPHKTAVTVTYTLR